MGYVESTLQKWNYMNMIEILFVVMRYNELSLFIE